MSSADAARAALSILADETRTTVGRLRRIGRALLGAGRGWVAALLLTWMLMIWSLSALSLSSGGERSFLMGVLGNLVHAPLFGLLALWALPLLPRRADGWPRLARAHFGAVVLGVALSGLVDEWHQSHVSGRTPSLLDLLTDCTGAACVLAIAAYLGRPQASWRGLRARLALALALCVAAAALSSVGPASWPG